MNALTAEQGKLQQLRTLYELREKRAHEAVVEQRQELTIVQDKLSEQRVLVRTLRDELEALHQMRSRSNIQQMTAHSLQAESDRRRWLLYDLEKEEYYIPAMESDVDIARAELAARQRAWTIARERIKVLEQQGVKIQSRIRQVQARTEDALLDERTTPGLTSYG